ncbi:MAG: hypothetical protein ACSHWZ_14910 [Sulfitobacter sp.]
MAELAVLTGDIVKSGALPAGGLERIFDALQKAADEMGRWQAEPPRLTRSRGDGWQVVTPPQFALRAALILRGAVRQTGKSHDTRLAIGFGAADLPSDDLAEASGAGFETSGRALEAMGRGARMVAEGGPKALQSALPLAAHISGGWTARQAEIAAVYLQQNDLSQEALAERFGVRQQSIQEQLDSSGCGALLLACHVLERGA